MIRRHTKSLLHAFRGLAHGLSTQPNFVIHLTLSFLVIILGLLLYLPSEEWLVIILTIAGGLAIELVNTAIESVVDLTTDQWHKNAKIAKDASAAAMLVYAIGAAIIACVIFLPKLWLYI